MIEFKDLTEAERVRACNNATDWSERHSRHVDQVMAEDKYSYPPSGSDIFHPELWKGGHWRWFFGSEAK